MDPLSFSAHFTSLESKVQVFDSFCKKSLSLEKYSDWREKGAPKFHKYAKEITELNNSAISALDTWQKKTPSQEKPYVFKDLSKVEKEELEKKSSFHKTIACVVLGVSIFFLFASIVAPFAMFPLFIALGETATAIINMAFVGVGAFGTALALSTIWIGNTEAIRLHTAKTDPDFPFFIDRIVQHKRKGDDEQIEGVGFNISEEHLTDKALHFAFLAWKGGIIDKEYFSEKKRNKINQEMPKITNLLKQQPKIFAEDCLEKLKKNQPDLQITDEQKVRSIELLSKKFEKEISQLQANIQLGSKVNSPIRELLAKEKHAYKKILKEIL